MTLEQKKDHILRCISLGMGVDKAYLIAECTLEEIEELSSDKLFQQRIELQYALEEKRLLEELQHASTGNARALIWKLEKVNPERYQTNKQKGVEPKNKHIPKVNIIIKGKGTDK